MSSIVNQNSGGGPKKAGLPYQIGREASVSVAFRNTSQNLTFLRGRRAVLEQILMFATQRLAKATAIRDAADALVTATIATAHALDNVSVTLGDDDADITGMITTLNVDSLKDVWTTADDDTTAKYDAKVAYDEAKLAADALQAIIDARASAATASGNVSTEVGKESNASTDLNNYTPAV
jgi:hypothetical protein